MEITHGFETGRFDVKARSLRRHMTRRPLGFEIPAAVFVTLSAFVAHCAVVRIPSLLLRAVCLSVEHRALRGCCFSGLQWIDRRRFACELCGLVHPVLGSHFPIGADASVLLGMAD